MNSNEHPKHESIEEGIEEEITDLPEMNYSSLAILSTTLDTRIELSPALCIVATWGLHSM